MLLLQIRPDWFAIDSVVPFGLIMATLLAVGALIARYSPFYRKTVVGQPNRFGSLDGLRGFLAFGVFFHHAHIYYFAFKTGEWVAPASRFYAAIGPGAVALFFMITGFLFWSKAIAKGGRIPAGELYLSRLWRIAPMYVFSMVALSVAVFTETGMHLNVSAGRLAEQFLRVFSLGLAAPKELNGIPTGSINASVTWTLYYEWLFYFALPLLALAVKPRAFLVMLGVAIGLRLGFRDSKSITWLFLFAGGMAAAHLVTQERIRRLFGREWVAIAWLILLGVGLAYSGDPRNSVNPRHLVAAIPCFGLFLSLVCGASFFNLLTCSAARLLGTVSYSTYLIHGIVLYTAVRCVNGFVPISGMTPAAYWGFELGCALAVLGVSCLTYRWVEHPGIEQGRRPLRKVAPTESVPTKGVPQITADQVR